MNTLANAIQSFGDICVLILIGIVGWAFISATIDVLHKNIWWK